MKTEDKHERYCLNLTPWKNGKLPPLSWNCNDIRSNLKRIGKTKLCLMKKFKFNKKGSYMQPCIMARSD